MVLIFSVFVFILHQTDFGKYLDRLITGLGGFMLIIGILLLLYNLVYGLVNLIRLFTYGNVQDMTFKKNFLEMRFQHLNNINGEILKEILVKVPKNRKINWEVILNENVNLNTGLIKNKTTSTTILSINDNDLQIMMSSNESSQEKNSNEIKQNWICEICNEEIESYFDSCWNCSN